jgi:type II secretory pathway pseudopilin PulG
MIKPARTIRCTRPRGRLGVTLAELIVAVAILAGMFVLIGRIFASSGKSSSIAIGTANANRALRVLMRTMRDDLEHIDLTNGYLVLRKVTLTDGENHDPPTGRFYLNQDEKDQYAPDPPPNPVQSDMLIFFTNRRTNSYTENELLPGFSDINPYTLDPGEAWREKDSSQLVQVVYGQANLVEYDDLGNRAPVWDGSSSTVFDIEATEQNQSRNQPLGEVFGSSLHLARRAVLMGEFESTVARLPLSDPTVIDATTDWVRRTAWMPTFYQQGYPPGNLPSPLPFPLPDMDGSFLRATNPQLTSWSQLRSLIDPYPPANQAHRLAYDFLPGCVEFEVSWTYESAEFDRYLLAAGLAYPGLQDGYPLTNTPVLGWDQLDSAPVRWYSRLDDRGSATPEERAVMDPITHRYNLYRDVWPSTGDLAFWPVYVPISVGPDLSLGTSDDQFAPIYPSALKVRVKLLDAHGGLTEPIESTFIVPIGAVQ